MVRSIGTSRVFLAYSLLLVGLGTLYFIASDVSNYSANSFFAIAITIDFTLFLPLVYLLLIRKSNIPNVTVVPVFVLCLAVAFYSIPAQFQGAIQWVELWVLPIVELSVLSFVGFKFYQIRKAFKGTVGNQKLDAYDAMVLACEKAFPGIAGKLLASELSMLYYGFLTWKKPVYQSNEFSIHKKSGVLVILAFIIGLVIVETGVIHLLVQNWNSTVAWILTILSIYSGMQVFGFLKSIPRRPIKFSESSLYLRFGIMSSVEIPYSMIEAAELNKKELSEETDIVELSPLGILGGGHNILIRSTNPLHLQKLFGMKKAFSEIVFFVDEPERFLEDLDTRKSS
ncbi:MAG: hypothetical protein ACO2ZZ_05215 [Cyclobacteriaceae bacterium]